MTTTAPPARLTRPRRVMVGGVCGGLADHLGWPVARTRVLMLAASAFGGAGVLLYAWLWALAPLADPDPDAEAGIRRSVPGAAILVAIALVTASIAALVPQGYLLVPGTVETVTLASAAVAWSLGFDRRDPGRSIRYGVTVRSLAAGLMILLGIVLLLKTPAAPTAVLAVLMIVLGSGVLFIPRVVTLWSELLTERAGRVREVQRAEIAAHLHDSVLQTLALIQNRAGASSEVARLARAQERELRDWLFAGTTPTSDDLPAELSDIAAAIELEYPARLDVVTTGESTFSSAALIGAAKEAMLNAARHAGGEVSVYVESSASAVDVFVRDRGPGLDLDALPVDRLGIRESIIGRMSRAGGSATVRSTHAGTEVHLHLEATNE